jgi:hypothetical protein
MLVKVLFLFIGDGALQPPLVDLPTDSYSFCNLSLRDYNELFAPPLTSLFKFLFCLLINISYKQTKKLRWQDVI